MSDYVAIHLILSADASFQVGELAEFKQVLESVSNENVQRHNEMLHIIIVLCRNINTEGCYIIPHDRAASNHTWMDGVLLLLLMDSRSSSFGKGKGKDVFHYCCCCQKD